MVQTISQISLSVNLWGVDSATAKIKCSKNPYTFSHLIFTQSEQIPPHCAAQPHHDQVYGHMARGSHGLHEVSLGLFMPYPSTSCKQQHMKWPHSHFRGSYPQGYPTPYASNPAADIASVMLAFSKRNLRHSPPNRVTLGECHGQANHVEK
jgi:hypothetical protein